MQYFQNISSKHRFFLLLGSFAFLLLFAYQFSIKNTFEYYSNYQKNKTSLEQAASAPEQIARHQNELEKLGNNFGKETYDRQSLFETVNTFCRSNGLSLSQFSPESQRSQNDYEILTSPIEVEGKYINMVRLAYELEYKKQLGHIASASFKKEKDIRTMRTYLKGLFYLQNLKSKNHAE